MKINAPDVNDVVAILGVAMIGGGVALVHVPSALIVVGLLLCCASLARFARRRAK